MLMALTFDDGPNTTITPQILDILERHGAVASFFLIAQNITPDSARVVRRALALGCEINNHSVSHQHMADMTPEQIDAEIRPCTERIQELTGQAPRFFRPPYISVSDTLFDQVDLTFICGSGCEDWIPETIVPARIDGVLSQVRDGQIILLHDSPGNTNTVEAVRFLVPELISRGVQLVTCGQLFDARGIQPRRHRLYSNVLQTADFV